MARVIARFRRGETLVKFLPDAYDNGYYVVTTHGLEPPTVEYFPLRYLDFHKELYTLNSFTLLVTCPACAGKGWEWCPDHNGEANVECCSHCQGEGGL